MSAPAFPDDRTEVLPPSLPWLAAPAKPDLLGQLGPYEITAVLHRSPHFVKLAGREPRLARPIILVVFVDEQGGPRPPEAAAVARVAAVSHDNLVVLHA